MALHTIGTKAATQLACLAGFSQVLLAADVAAVSAAIVDDGGFGRILGGYSAGISYVLATATTAGTANLTALAATAGSPPISQIMPSDIVVASAGIVPTGTYVVSVSGTTAVLSAPAISTGTLQNMAFVRASTTVSPEVDKMGLLYVPKRGVLKLLPGDVVARDSTGWPILVSANSIAFAGSDWTFT